MPIVGRDFDPSERKEVLQWISSMKSIPAGVGVSNSIGQSLAINLFMIPCPATIQQGAVAAFGGLSGGVSGAVTLTFNVLRFASGSTSYLFASMALASGAGFGLSGPVGLSGMLASGHTLLNVQYGDIVQLVTSGTGAMNDLVVELVIKKTQDIVAINNVQT